MNNCPAQSDFQELADSMLADFDRRVASIPKDLCASFHAEARQLEAELLTIYKTIVLCVRKEEGLERIAAWWNFMVQMCDQSAQRLSRLNHLHPACGAEVYYDRVLDLRNKCHRLAQMHS